MNIIDLSQTIAPEMTVFPGDIPPRIQTIPGKDYQLTELTFRNHTGTHLDAPSHFFPDAPGLDQLDISRFFGLSLLLDVTAYAGQEIPLEFLQAQEELLKHCQFLTLRTGWDQYWNTPAYLSGYPLLSAAAAEYLAQFPLSGLALDCISPDAAGSLDIHRILLSAGLVILENLTGLDQISGQVFLLSALPLKWRDCNGSPVRAVALEAPAGIYYPA